MKENKLPKLKSAEKALLKVYVNDWENTITKPLCQTWANNKFNDYPKERQKVIKYIIDKVLDDMKYHLNPTIPASHKSWIKSSPSITKDFLNIVHNLEEKNHIDLAGVINEFLPELEIE